MAAPHAANGCEHDEGPLSALPAHAIDRRPEEKLSWPWSEGHRSPIGGVVLIARERGPAKVENDESRGEIREQEKSGGAQSPQPRSFTFCRAETHGQPLSEQTSRLLIQRLVSFI
jgi:hypothetical protein